MRSADNHLFAARPEGSGKPVSMWCRWSVGCNANEIAGEIELHILYDLIRMGHLPVRWCECRNERHGELRKPN